jgi:hypothetical protein
MSTYGYSLFTKEKNLFKNLLRKNRFKITGWL